MLLLLPPALVNNKILSLNGKKPHPLLNVFIKFYACILIILLWLRNLWKKILQSDRFSMVICERQFSGVSIPFDALLKSLHGELLSDR